MLIVYMCHMHGCVFCAGTEEFYSRQWCCRMCKSVGNTKMGLGDILFHAFVDCCVNSVLWSKFVVNTKRFWQSKFFCKFL